MAQRLGHLFFLGFFVFSSTLAFLPLPVHAALVPCGRTPGPNVSAAETAPCTVCHLVLGGKGLIDWGLRVMTYIAIAVIVAMAILYIVSTGDEGLMGTAKGGIKAAFIGFIIMLGAWLIVNTILTLFGAKIVGSGFTRAANSFNFSCNTVSNVKP